MVSHDEGQQTNTLSPRHIYCLYNTILRHLQIIFAKQLNMFDDHRTLLETERESFLTDIRLLKLYIEKEKMNVQHSVSAPQNSNEGETSHDSDECYSFCDDSSSVESTQATTGTTSPLVPKKDTFNNNTISYNAPCAGIGNKDS